jgi:urease accessory protein
MAHFRSRAEPHTPAIGAGAESPVPGAQTGPRAPQWQTGPQEAGAEGRRSSLPEPWTPGSREAGGAHLHAPGSPAGVPRDQAGWQAELALEFEVRQERSVLARAEHRGPLRVQRPFYPERDGTCHVYLLHPPGGLASGDQLRVSARLARGACALVTTPGAGKFYRARESARGVEAAATLSQQLQIGPGARLEWFPQESIVFEGAEARVVSQVELAPDAAFAGWEIVCLGRPACGEAFRRGSLRSELSLRVGGRLRFMERGLYGGGEPVLSERWGLGGAPVFGTFVVAHPLASAAWLEPLRDQIESRAGLFGVTLVSGVIVGRYLGGSTLDARACFERMFSLLRPHYAQSAAVAPRIWST